MFPSNKTVIVQNNINEDGSLQHKDTGEEQKKKKEKLMWMQLCTDLVSVGVSQ